MHAEDSLAQFITLDLVPWGKLISLSWSKAIDTAINMSVGAPEWEYGVTPGIGTNDLNGMVDMDGHTTRMAESLHLGN